MIARRSRAGRPRHDTRVARGRHLALLGTLSVALLVAYVAGGASHPRIARAAADAIRDARPLAAIVNAEPARLEGASLSLDGRAQPPEYAAALAATTEARPLVASIVSPASSPPASNPAASSPAASAASPPSAAIEVRAAATAPAPDAAVATPVTPVTSATPATIAAARIADPAPPPPPEATPARAAAPVAAPPASARYATRAEVILALSTTRWDPAHWATVVGIAFCEAGMDTDRDGVSDVVDTQANGAGGTYVGALQIERGHRFTRPYGLGSLVDNLAAGYELWLDAGRSFAPWGCR